MSRSNGSFSLSRDLVASLRQPDFWSFAAWLDILSKYRRSRLGIGWMFVPPIATFGLLGYFYAGLTGRDPMHFIPFMGTGYMLWRLVTQVFGEVSTTMLSHRAFIMDGRTRLTDYVLRCMSKAFLYFTAAVLVMFVILSVSPEYQIVRSLTLLFTVPLFLLNLFSLSVVIALLGARFPDMHEFTTTIFIFGFLLTPILWYPENLDHSSLRWIFMQINPAYHFIEMVRAPLLGREIGAISIAYVMVVTLVGGLTANVLYRRYARFVPLWI